MKTTVQEHASQTQTAPAPVRYVTPGVNIFETAEGWTLQAEMPGVNKDGLTVTLEGTELTIVGHRTASTGDLTPLFRESAATDYRRVFELDPATDAAKIVAQMDQGVLTLHLPKSEQVKPRRIAVTA